MKLQPHELFAALGKLLERIENCGGSPELTAAVVLASDIMSAVGDKWNPANEFAAQRVLAAIGPVNPDNAVEPSERVWTLPDFGKELETPSANTLHLLHKPHTSFTDGLLVPSGQGRQKYALSHFSGGFEAVIYSRLDEIIYVAGLHGWKVTTEGDPNSTGQ